MKYFINNKLKESQKRFKEIKKLLENTNVVSKKEKFKSLSKEYIYLNDVIYYLENWLKLQHDIIITQEMLEDLEIRSMVEDELKQLKLCQNNNEEKIKKLLNLNDPDDQYNCFLEIRAGTGGKEATLFAKELFRMYSRYAEMRRWHVEIININYGEYGGYKEIIIKLSNNKGIYGQLKFESGGHRVQRIPYTESQGRLHTSTCTIAVMPDIPEIKLPTINNNDIRIDTFKSSGAGGQHVNTTDSAIRITHIPTGLIVECQDERSQHKNKSKALAVLNARLNNLKIQKKREQETFIRRNLLGTGDRSDRIRTYNFPKNRVTDHRINLTVYRLNEIIEGKLDILIQPTIQKHNFYQIK